MKKLSINKTLFITLFSLMGANASAYDIAVENADGVTIYYNYINDGKELEVIYENANNYSYSGNVVIPEEVTYINITRKVTSIGGSAFAGCSNLTYVTIPNSVTSIGRSSFFNCSSLKSVSFGNNLPNISSDAFRGCNIESVYITDLSAWCKAFTENSFNPILNNYHLYLNGIEIKQLIIPEDITSIGNYTFYGCSHITSVIIPNSVTNIGASAFQGCSKMETLTLPDGLQIIRQSAFKGCNNLKSITIPATVEYIYQEAFDDCNRLEIVNALPTTPPFLYDNSFSNFTIPLKVPKGCKKAYQNAQGWKNFTNIIDADKYKLTYMVDGEEYKSFEIEEGETITPIAEPTKEGYTFSGWSDIPETMPAKDVTVTGTFTVNKYKLTYFVDGEEYKSYDIEYGSTITSETEPTKEGYTFSGWSDLPETMPAKDVTVTGTFTVNKYKLTYSVDGEEYKSYDIEYGSTITSETEPTKEGYTFSGWSDLPETMPAKDVTVTGTFTINKYKVTYMIDGEVYQTVEVEYGSTITPPNPGDREGYDFAWGDYPSTMPAKDITINGSYTATDIKAILSDESDVKIYNVSGKPLNNLQKGVNILRYKDGRTQKLIIK